MYKVHYTSTGSYPIQANNIWLGVFLSYYLLWKPLMYTTDYRINGKKRKRHTDGVETFVVCFQIVFTRLDRAVIDNRVGLKQNT